MSENHEIEISKAPRDHVIAAIKAALSAVPFVGGSIASLISDYVQTSTERGIRRALALLEEKLMALNGRIDIDAVKMDDFSELFKSCYLVIVRTNREEKLQAATALLANLLLQPNDPKKSSYEELDHLVRCLEALSIGAISVLAAVHEIGANNPPTSRAICHFPQLQSKFPQFDSSLLMSLVSESRGLNLLHVQDGGVRAPDNSHVLIELTAIGRRFLERFIEGNM
jgi:hypothetical protein